MKRRTFMIGSAAILGGLAIGYRAVGPGEPDDLSDLFDEHQTPLNPYVLVDESGITIITPRAEMGQGIHTTLAAMVAEELDVALADVKVEHGPASELYANNRMFAPAGQTGFVGRLKALGSLSRRSTQLTGAQSSSQDGFLKMRQAGAAARSILVAAAASRLDVAADVLGTENGAVVSPDGSRIPYTELAAAAAAIAPPQDPPLKPRSEWTVLGRSQPRVDMVGKCTGTATYAIDVRLPDMLYATVRMNPNLGGPMRGFDATRAEGMTGVKQIIPLAGGVIVVATNTWYAFQAANAIAFDWGPAPYPEALAEHKQQVSAALENNNSLRTRNDGDVDGVLTNGAAIEREYEVPYLAHATMEPLNAIAWLNGNRLDIWAGNQWPTSARLDSADLAGVPPEAVHVHTTYMGGGFGRRLETDFIKVAVEAARAMAGTPVKVTWSREEDMTHDAYRPMAKARCRAALTGNRPRALDIQLAAPPLFGSHDYRSRGTYTDRPDVSIPMGAGYQPYDIENYRVTSHAAGQLLPVGWWRGVGESQNGFFVETFMDELAYAAGQDPLELRLALLKDATSRAVLQSVAIMSNWGSALPEGHARGVAFFRSSGAPTAQVIEIRDTARGIELVKAFVAADVGIALDPRNLTGQLEGALIFGLTAAMFGEITVTDGRVDQTNFDQYDLLRIHQMPAIEVKIHENGQRLFGVGEATTPTAAPALGNAIHALTGSRLRALPFHKFVRFA